MSDVRRSHAHRGGLDPLAGRMPVTVVTGFLGSGKTTLINRLPHKPEMNRVAVIINEFGEVGLDNELVEASASRSLCSTTGVCVAPCGATCKRRCGIYSSSVATAK